MSRMVPASVLVLATAFAAQASAQIQVTPVIGIYQPIGSFEKQDLLTSTGETTGTMKFGRARGLIVGLRGVTPVVGRFGLGLSVLHAWTAEIAELVSGQSPGYNPLFARRHVQLIAPHATLEVLPTTSRLQLQIWGGPALVGSGPSFLSFRERQWAGSFGGGVDYRVSHSLDLASDIEMYIHRDPVDGLPRQSDVVFTLGVRFNGPRYVRR